MYLHCIRRIFNQLIDQLFKQLLKQDSRLLPPLLAPPFNPFVRFDPSTFVRITPGDVFQGKLEDRSAADRSCIQQQTERFLENNLRYLMLLVIILLFVFLGPDLFLL